MQVSDTALILIDVINDLKFPGADGLVRHALPMAKALAVLKRRTKAASIPAIYVNDNYGRWHQDFRQLVTYCLASNGPGRKMAEILKPEDDDYFILKPRHSAFYQTNLDSLIAQLRIRRLILTGIAADMCVLFTASDAHMRELAVCVPSDCVASETIGHRRQALQLMSRVLKATIVPSDDVLLTGHAA